MQRKEWLLIGVIFLFWFSIEDIRHQSLSVIGLWIWTAICLWGWMGQDSKVEGVLGALVGVVFCVISWVLEEKIGLGDGWLIGNVGVLLGAQRAIYAVGIAFILAGIYSGVLLTKNKFKKEALVKRIPFCPWLFLSYLVVIGFDK